MMVRSKVMHPLLCLFTCMIKHQHPPVSSCFLLSMKLFRHVDAWLFKCPPVSSLVHVETFMRQSVATDIMSQLKEGLCGCLHGLRRETNPCREAVEETHVTMAQPGTVLLKQTNTLRLWEKPPLYTSTSCRLWRPPRQLLRFFPLHSEPCDCKV